MQGPQDVTMELNQNLEKVCTFFYLVVVIPFKKTKNKYIVYKLMYL